MSFGVLALTICLSALAGEPPVEVILESWSVPDPEPAETWSGEATIWLDGIKYEGTVLYMHERRTMNDNSWHGVETQIFDFGDLGTLTVSGTARTKFDYVSPEHRWHYYTSHTKISDGTGAFAEAQGVFQFQGYTDWHFPPFPPDGYGWGGATAMIVGIQLP